MSSKQTQLIEASIDLFAKEGFWNTPTARIAKHAGVATGTLFNYFASKDALIDAVYLQLKQEWAAYVLDGFPENGDVKTGLEHIWFRFIRWGVDNSVRYSLMMQLKLSDLVSAEAQRQQEDTFAFGQAIIAQSIADGVLKEVDVTYFGEMFIAQLEAAVRYAIDHNLRDMPLTKHITTGFDLFWAGVAA